MALLEYSSARWLALRQQCFLRDGFRCVLCNALEPLECHHRTYTRAGEEWLSDLTTLCAPCHLMVTDFQRRTRYTRRIVPALHDAPVDPLWPIALLSPTSSRVPICQDLPARPQDAKTVHHASTYKEIALETNTAVPTDRHHAADHALWTTRRSVEPLE